jgi:hypothetical protein
MQPPPEKFVAFKAEANVVSCARQLRTGLYRSDLGWRGLGDWNQTSSTLGQRAPDGRIRWSNAFGLDINRLHHRQVGRLRIRVVAGFNSEIPSRLNLGAKQWFLGLTRRLRPGASSNSRKAARSAPQPSTSQAWLKEPPRRAYSTFLNLVEHHSKESTVHRFEPARPRNRAQHIAANTE